MANLLDRKKAKSEYDKAYRLANKESISTRMKAYYLTLTHEQKELRKQYRESTRDKARQYSSVYRNTNKEIVRAKIKDWYYKNKDRKSRTSQLWKESNRGIVNSIAAKRRAAKLKATPKWADLLAIREFYKNCPQGYHVDHIVPLQGKNICGLHVSGNLQYLPASENCSKGNRYE